MSIETPVGLREYPITKICMVTTVIVPLIAAVTNVKFLFLAQFDPFVYEYHQYYRYLLFQLGCLNESDVILLVLIWYNFRHLERLFGSYKYLNIISLIWLYTSFIIVFSNMAVNTFIPGLQPGYIWNRLPSGPLPLVLALFHFYKQFTPKIYQFQLLLFAPPKLWGKGNNNTIEDGGISNRKRIMLTLTDQFIVDALVILLVLNQGLVGIFCGFVSWMIGILIEKGLFLGMDHWELPFINWFLNDTKPRTVRLNVPATDETTSSPEDDLLEGRLPHNITEGPSYIDDNSTAMRNNEGPLRSETLRFPNSNTIETGSNDHIGDTYDQIDDEPIRPLRQQFLDVFRR